ncbi:hypothetical protein VTI28DRAFT_10403 [Corynascus sepedonium]
MPRCCGPPGQYADRDVDKSDKEAWIDQALRCAGMRRLSQVRSFNAIAWLARLSMGLGSVPFMVAHIDHVGRNPTLLHSSSNNETAEGAPPMQIPGKAPSLRSARKPFPEADICAIAAQPLNRCMLVHGPLYDLAA